MNAEPGSRPAVAAARRVVLKLGTRVLAHADGSPALERLASVVEAAAGLHGDGREPILVSSGAVGLGIAALGHGSVPRELEERQACAAVGQTRLMGLYAQGFARFEVACGQVLLTQGDFDDRLRYLNLRSTLSTLLRRRVVPVVNENDAVSTEELAFVEGASRPVFGDNDKLSALVATKLDAELLVLLTDVEGVHDRDPRRHPDAGLLETVEDARALAAGVGAGSTLSRGGMRSKVEAATMAARAGCHAVIASGLDPTALPRVLRGERVGTWFPARTGISARRVWMAYAAAPRGTLWLDAGAVTAVRERGASLLAAGVEDCEGGFEAGDVVELREPGGEVIGRGIVFCDAETTRAWRGGSRPAGIRNHHALIHRDHMVLKGET